MNPFTPPPNARKVVVKDGSVVHTPESFLALMNSYKRQNPVKFARKEEALKKRFVSLGGKADDFKVKIEKNKEELEVEIKGLKEAIQTKEEIEAANAELKKEAETLNEEIERLKKERILASKK